MKNGAAAKEGTDRGKDGILSFFLEWTDSCLKPAPLLSIHPMLSSLLWKTQASRDHKRAVSDPEPSHSRSLSHRQPFLTLHQRTLPRKIYKFGRRMDGRTEQRKGERGREGSGESKLGTLQRGCKTCAARPVVHATLHKWLQFGSLVARGGD